MRLGVAGRTLLVAGGAAALSVVAIQPQPLLGEVQQNRTLAAGSPLSLLSPALAESAAVAGGAMAGGFDGGAVSFSTAPPPSSGGPRQGGAS